jgi:hypothetical protein
MLINYPHLSMLIFFYEIWYKHKHILTPMNARAPYPMSKDSSGSVLGRIPAGFGSCGFGFGDGFSPTVFGFGFGFGIEFGFGFGFSPVDIRNKSFGIKTHVL